MLARCMQSVVRSCSVRTAVISSINKELQAIKDAGTYKNERIIVGRQGMEISTLANQKTLLNFCANNYLGLCDNEEVIEAGKRALNTHGAGVSSVRFICGTQDIHKTLEGKIAEYHGREDAIIYASCFDANAGLFEVITTDNQKSKHKFELKVKFMQLRKPVIRSPQQQYDGV